MPRPPRASLDHGQGPAGPSVEVDGQRLRVRTARCATPWLPDTPSNRPLTLVWFRLLVDAHGQPLCTLQEFATLVGRTNRQAASQPREDVRQGGAARRALVLRQRTVDAAVVEGVVSALLQTPLAGPTALVPRVNARLSRQDLTVAHSAGAWEQSACVPVLRTLRRQLEAGPVHSHEASLVTELLEHLSLPATRPAGGSVPSAERGMRSADPTALAALVTPDRPLAHVPGSLCWLPCLMTLCSWHVPLAVLGRWCGVQKTPILRWV